MEKLLNFLQMLTDWIPSLIGMAVGILIIRLLGVEIPDVPGAILAMLFFIVLGLILCVIKGFVKAIIMMRQRTPAKPE